MMRARRLIAVALGATAAIAIASAQDAKPASSIARLNALEKDGIAAWKAGHHRDANTNFLLMLALVERATDLAVQDVRHFQREANIGLCVSYAAMGEKPKALDALERAVQWGFVDDDFLKTPPFDPLRDEPRFKAIVADLARVFRPGRAAPTERWEETIDANPLGLAHIALKVTMDEAAWSRFKRRASPIKGVKDGVYLLGAPTASSVLGTLPIQSLPVWLEPPRGTFDDAAHCFTADYVVHGALKNHGGRYSLALDESDHWQIASVKSATVILATVDRHLDHIEQHTLVANCPPWATGFQIEQRPSRLVFAMPPLTFKKPAFAPLRTTFELVGKPYLVSALYKLYGDPRWEKFWLARATLKNVTHETLRQYRVRFRVIDWSSWSPWQVCDVVYPGQNVVDAYHPVVYAKVCELKSATPANLEAEFEYVRPDGSKVTGSESAALKLLGINEGVSHVDFTKEVTWSDIGRDKAELFAAFTCGSDPVMAEIAGMIQHELGGAWSNHTDQDAIKFVEQLYNLMRCNIAYEGARVVASGEGDSGQFYKYGRDVLRTKSGTCVNLAIFFASVCEAAGQKPILYEIPGHVFVGVRLPESAKVVFVETTGCGAGTPEGSADFLRAASAAERKYSEYAALGFLREIDIAAMRAVGVMPPDLPDVPKTFVKECELKRSTIASQLVASAPTKPAAPAAASDAKLREIMSRASWFLVSVNAPEKPGSYRRVRVTDAKALAALVDATSKSLRPMERAVKSWPQGIYFFGAKDTTFALGIGMPEDGVLAVQVGGTQAFQTYAMTPELAKLFRSWVGKAIAEGELYTPAKKM